MNPTIFIRIRLFELLQPSLSLTGSDLMCLDFSGCKLGTVSETALASTIAALTNLKLLDLRFDLRHKLNPCSKTISDVSLKKELNIS